MTRRFQFSLRALLVAMIAALLICAEPAECQAGSCRLRRRPTRCLRDAQQLRTTPHHVPSRDGGASSPARSPRLGTPGIIISPEKERLLDENGNLLTDEAARKIRVDRKNAIDDAVAAVAYRKKIINRLYELINAGKLCPDQDIIDELERKLREAEDELRKVKGK